jgi:hypothetical protein
VIFTGFGRALGATFAGVGTNVGLSPDVDQACGGGGDLGTTALAVGGRTRSARESAVTGPSLGPAVVVATAGGAATFVENRETVTAVSLSAAVADAPIGSVLGGAAAVGEVSAGGASAGRAGVGVSSAERAPTRAAVSVRAGTSIPNGRFPSRSQAVTPAPSTVALIATNTAAEAAPDRFGRSMGG